MQHINEILENSIRKNWEELALTDFGGISLQYRDIARKIAKLHLLFKHAGINKEEKIALCGKNSTQWAVAFMAAMTYGAVPVPILHEFKPDQIHNLLNHSDSRILFCDFAIYKSIDITTSPEVDAVFNIADYSLLYSKNTDIDYARAHLNELFGKSYPERFTPNDVVYEKPDVNRLAIINYTSGSTGFSKGVMIPYRAISSNIDFGLQKLTFLGPKDNTICMLPMAHMYGLAIELLHPLSKGCHVHFITRVPSPKIVMDAFAATRPRLIITVPLVLEKIIKNKVFPLLEKPYMRLLTTMPFVNDILLTKIKNKLQETFGGQLVEIIIGGAALNADVERFLRRIRFPYTVGYGMTECAPIIAYSHWNTVKPGSCGKAVVNMEIRIDSDDPVNVPGEVQVRGANVFLGYYKNEEATANSFTDDGWFRTGDMGVIDRDGYLFLRGRSKCMILGPSGQNIYPEELEAVINNLTYVVDSLVIEDEGGLTALIYPDYHLGELDGLDRHGLEERIRAALPDVNKLIPNYAKIKKIEFLPEDFERTPKRSIKRYLYQRN